MPVPSTSRQVSIGLVAVPDVSAAVIYGLHEVFTSVGTAWEQITGEPARGRRFRPRIVAGSAEAIRTTMGPLIAPDSRFGDAFHFDAVIVADLNMPPGVGPKGRWRETAKWLRHQYDRGAIICSVCTGSLMLAEAGLLDDTEATTHWSASALFRTCYPKVVLKAERVLVPAGAEHRIVTSGGSASWTDLALYLIARFAGDDEARRIAKIFLFGDRSDGQLPFAAMVRPKQHEDAAIAESQVWIADRYAEPHPVGAMAERSGLTERTFKRRFKSATGYAPLDYVQTLRIEESKQALETTDDPIDEIAAAVGYDDPNSFRRLFKRTTGISPSRYRQRFRTIAPG
ncbi:MAG: GlxA family transcriptional regulator [Geminicoccaceae bacterium]